MTLFEQTKAFCTREKFILLTLLFYFLVSFAFITKYDLWRDEAFSVNVAQKPVEQLIAIVGRDVHPPLHLLVLKGWMAIFGDSVTAVRSLSVVFGALAIVLAHAVAREVFEKKEQQHWAVLLVATSPHLLFYALEARVYTMLMASVLGLVLATLLALHNRKRWVDSLFIVSVLSGLYGHVIFIPALVGVFIWQIILLSTHLQTMRNKKVYALRMLKRFAINYVIIGIAFIPWLTALFYQLSQVGEQGFWLGFDPIPDLLNSLKQFYVTEKVSTSADLLAPVWIHLLSSVGLGITILSFFKQKKHFYLSLLAILTIIPVYLASFHTPIYFIRYLTYAIPLLMFSVAIGLSVIETALGKKATYGIACALVLLNVYCFAGNIQQQPGIKAEYRQAISFIVEQYPAATIIHPHGYTLHSFLYYSPEYFTQPGKLYDPERKLPHFEGLAAFSDENYYQGALGSEKIIVTPYLGQDQGFEDLVHAAGYVQINYAEYPGGLHLKVWRKLPFAADN